METILIVEDDNNLRLLTKLNLESNYKVLEASDGIQALTILENTKVDLIISDIMMPKLNGNELLSEIRNDKITTPLILLTAKADIHSKYEGYDLGADDYLTKPVDYNELKYKIKVLLKRTVAFDSIVKIHETVIDRENYTIYDENNKITLPQKEFDLLYLLFSNIDRVYTYDEILSRIWGVNSLSDENTIRTHINRLRKKISSFKSLTITTCHGVGYKGESYEN